MGQFWGLGSPEDLPEDPPERVWGINSSYVVYQNKNGETIANYVLYQNKKGETIANFQKKGLGTVLGPGFPRGPPRGPPGESPGGSP